MHLVGFTIEIYYNAWPYERQICMSECGERHMPQLMWCFDITSFKFTRFYCICS